MMPNLVKTITSISLLISSIASFAQKSTLEKTVLNYTGRFSSVNELANKIQADFKKQEDKAKAAYVWMANHISYDIRGINKQTRVAFTYSSEADLKAQKRAFRKELAHKTLRRRKAVCEGYATLYKELCTQFNIECEIITGSSKTFISEIGNTRLPSNHSWNAIKINGTWRLVDVTWGAGSVNYSQMRFERLYTSSYFNSKPYDFRINHFPDKKQWQLIDKKISLKDFGEQHQVFQAYWDSKIELRTPQKGIIEYKKGDRIQFAIENLSPQSHIAYKYRNEKYGNQIKINRNGKTSHFSIPMTHLRKNELIIYIDTKPALGFKTLRR